MMTKSIDMTGRVRFFRFVFLVLAWGLVACIVAQTLIAGMAVFNDPTHWSKHVTFVHIFEFVPILMLICAFAGRLPKGTGWLSFALFGCIYLQYMTANLPAAGALHPVMALVLIVLSLFVAKRAYRSCFNRIQAENGAGASSEVTKM
jgi:mercuric ion transport protein